jgi:hypothetical protein
MPFKIGLAFGRLFEIVGYQMSVNGFVIQMNLFRQVGETIDANLGIIIIGLCKMAGNIFSALIIDRVGRY